MNRENCHSKPADPNNDSGASEVQRKQCSDCKGLFPLNFFGPHKLGKMGLQNQCHPCRGQDFRRRRRKRYGLKGRIDDSLIRRMSVHNETVLNMVIGKVCTLFAYHPVSGQVYKVVLGPSEVTTMNSMAIFNMDGSQYHEYLYSGQDPTPAIQGLVKALGIRLEMTEYDMMVSKQVIYFL